MSKAKKKKKKVAKKKQVRPPLDPSTFARMGVLMTVARQNQQQMLAEVIAKAPGMQRLRSRLEEAITDMKQSEMVLTNYGKQFFPDMKWPRTVAYWRKDLCRTH